MPKEITAMLLRLKRHEQATQHIHSLTQTFAALSPVVDITRWAIAAFHGSLRVHAFAFAVTASVVLQALVNI